MRHLALFSLAALAMAPLAPQSDGFNSSTAFFESASLGIRVDHFDWATAKRAGGESYSVTGRVSVMGQAPHDVAVREESESAESGGRQTLTIIDQPVDKPGTQPSVFAYSPTSHSVTISSGTSAVTVVQNPDNSYWVNGQHAQNTTEAIALLKGASTYEDISVYDFAMAHAVSQRPQERSVLRTGGARFVMEQRGEDLAQQNSFGALYGCVVCDKRGDETCSQRCTDDALQSKPTRRNHSVKRDTDGTHTVENVRKAPLFKKLVVNGKKGQVYIGAVTVTFEYTDTKTVLIDGTPCTTNADILDVLEKKQIKVKQSEIKEFLEDLNEKHVNFDHPGMNEGFMTLLTLWRPKLIAP